MTGIDSTLRGRELGRRLRAAQQSAGLDGKRLAHLLGWSEARVSRMFTGRHQVREVDVAAVLALCGVTGAPRERMLRLCQPHGVDGLLRLTVPQRWPALLAHAQDAVRVVEVHPALIPWLAQTPDYTRGLVPAEAAWPAQRAVVDFDLVDLRRVEFVLYEGALRTLVDDPRVMFSQLSRLVRIATRPSVSLRVVPAGRAVLVAGYGPFTLLEYAGHRPVVYREEPAVGVFVDTDHEVRAYRAVLDHLNEVALTPEDSHDLIVQIAAEFDAMPAI